MDVIVHLFNGLKGFMVVSGQRLGDGFYWRPCLPGMRQYVVLVWSPWSPWSQVCMADFSDPHGSGSISMGTIPWQHAMKKELSVH